MFRSKVCALIVYERSSVDDAFVLYKRKVKFSNNLAMCTHMQLLYDLVLVSTLVLTPNPRL